MVELVKKLINDGFSLVIQMKDGNAPQNQAPVPFPCQLSVSDIFELMGNRTVGLTYNNKPMDKPSFTIDFGNGTVTAIFWFYA